MDLVEQAVTESRTYTEQEALAAKPPLIDLLGADVPDLLAKLDGRSVTRFDGRVQTLRTAGATTRPGAHDVGRSAPSARWHTRRLPTCC